ncbi:MAG: glycosyltransferase family 4 protein [Elusimicrobiota bacterium]|jgi:glycosyltransferase involved in cell wall biosynthesis
MKQPSLLLLVPSASDPAHRRVSLALSSHLSRSGLKTDVFAPRTGLADLRIRRDLTSALARTKPAICHAHFFSRGMAWLEPGLLPPEARLVLTHQGASLDLMEHPGAFQSLARRAEAVTAVSRTGLSELLSSMPWIRPKAAMVPNGADPPRPCLPGPRTGREYVLCVGRLAAYKGTDLLLMAFADLLAQGFDLDLVVAGPDQTSGSLYAFARSLGVSGRVRFTGAVPLSEVASLLAGCLFFVLPSRQENMPMALLEALAAGKPAVAAAAGGVREVIRHGRNGLLIPPGDVPALARAMARLARDNRLRDRLGKAASRDGLHWSWSSAAARYLRLYGWKPKGRGTRSDSSFSASFLAANAR